MSYVFKLYIQDEGSRWVDFSDRLQEDEKGNLSAAGTVSKSLVGDDIISMYKTNKIKLALDNSQFFWDNVEKWEDIKTVDGNIADFNLSKNNYEIKLTNNWAKLACFDKNDNYYSLGIYKIESLSTNLSQATANMSLISISNYLQKRDANIVKDGQNWYINRSITFLLEKLLNEADSGDTFETNLPDTIKIPTYKNIRTFSQLGQPPQRMKNNLYNPYIYLPYTEEFNDEFRHEGLEGVFDTEHG